MSNIPENLKYTKDHEWVRVDEDGTLKVGITDYAQQSLGDITFVELPAEGESFQAGEVFGAVESVKAASDLYLPVDGEVIAVNPELDGAPERVNDDPYGEGWMIQVAPKDPAQVDGLLGKQAYAELLQ